MGWFKEVVKCLSACSIRLRVKCKSNCCESNCMLEESPHELSSQVSSSAVSEQAKNNLLINRMRTAMV